MTSQRAITQIIQILLAGWIVLVGAIVLNAIAGWLGLLSWYDILSSRLQSNISGLDYIWLLICYPLGLGSLVWVANRVILWYNQGFVSKK